MNRSWFVDKEPSDFDKADAVFAVDHIKVDWNREAVQSAEDYLSMSGMSRAGLFDQLASPLCRGSGD
jgi:hypothetical protein